jgi:hypothetical protein
VTAPFLFVGCVAAFYPHCRGSRRSGRNGVTFHRIEPASPPGVASRPDGCLQEPENRDGYFVILNVSSAQFIGDVESHIA